MKTLPSDAIAILGSFGVDFIDALQDASSILDENGISATAKADLRAGLAQMVNVKTAELSFVKPTGVVNSAASSSSSSWLMSSSAVSSSSSSSSASSSSSSVSMLDFFAADAADDEKGEDGGGRKITAKTVDEYFVENPTSEDAITPEEREVELEKEGREVGDDDDDDDDDEDNSNSKQAFLEGELEGKEGSRKGKAPQVIAGAPLKTLFTLGYVIKFDFSPPDDDYQRMQVTSTVAGYGDLISKLDKSLTDTYVQRATDASSSDKVSAYSVPSLDVIGLNFPTIPTTTSTTLRV